MGIALTLHEIKLLYTRLYEEPIPRYLFFNEALKKMVEDFGYSRLKEEKKLFDRENEE